MNNQKVLKEEIDKLTEQIHKLEEKREEEEHEARKTLLQTKTKLQFQTNRADQYEQKYKSALQYKNQEESLQDLTEKLGQKENEIIKLLQNDHEKSQEIQSLMEQAEQLRNEKQKLTEDLNHIKEAALSAIMDKDSTIGELTAKLQQYQDNEGMNNLRALILELQEKYRDLQERSEAHKIENLALLEEKEGEVNELHERLTHIKDKNDERVARLEQEIIEYEKHIEEITALKDHEENFEEKYYHTEEKLRKTEKKIIEIEQLALEERNELVQAIQKIEQEVETTKGHSEELKDLRTKTKELQKQVGQKRKQLDETRQKLDKSTIDMSKKISSLQNEKKLIGDNLNIKQQEIERLKAQLEQQPSTPKMEQPTLKRVKSNTSLGSPQKREEELVLIEKLKKQNKDIEDVNESLKKKLEQQTKELQQLRQKLLATRGGETSSEANKLRLQIEELNSYLKKVENDMLIKKIKHAEDENFWSIKEKKFKNEIENLNKKYKKQNSELLERIDRMKKLIPKDKKTDYYQSGFK